MTAEAAKNQSPANVVLDVNQKTVSGLAKGTYFTATPDGDLSAAEKGADGSVVFTDIPPGWFVVKLVLMPTSDANDVLEDALASGKLFPFTARDLLGRMLCTTPGAKVKARPEIKFADTVQTNEWSLFCTYGKLEARGSRVAV